MDLELRIAVGEDARAVGDLVDRAYAGYIERMGRKPGPMLDDYAALIAGGLVRVICRDGRIRGVLVLIEKDDHLLLDNIAVDPETQGLGIGRRLVEAAEAAARRLGYATVRLYTHETMVENVALYEHLGFSITHRAKDRGYDRIYMAKAVG
ncbi:MAG: GNAT family N-acetyltransferase [Rhodospirillaceae bacterium]|nr:GNAT family N-acetyltransferase [Rhodospirillaceae bacterium]MYH36478.1 GNAT family N-acetyltransferase [Rhodospirillaceae bacterium]MYK13319.1 GNAT family N-acetyltransferase [Rhodospirillaceae bacterium]